MAGTIEVLHHESGSSAQTENVFAAEYARMKELFAHDELQGAGDIRWAIFPNRRKLELQRHVDPATSDASYSITTLTVGAEPDTMDPKKPLIQARIGINGLEQLRMRRVLLTAGVLGPHAAISGALDLDEDSLRSLPVLPRKAITETVVSYVDQMIVFRGDAFPPFRPDLGARQH